MSWTTVRVVWRSNGPMNMVAPAVPFIVAVFKMCDSRLATGMMRSRVPYLEHGVSTALIC